MITVEEAVKLRQDKLDRKRMEGESQTKADYQLHDAEFDLLVRPHFPLYLKHIDLLVRHSAESGEDKAEWLPNPPVPSRFYNDLCTALKEAMGKDSAFDIYPCYPDAKEKEACLITWRNRCC